MLAAIPYRTYETFLSIGGLDLRTFGLMVGLGVLAGAWVAGRYGERFGVSRDVIYSLATRMVIAGVIGARIAWVVTNLEQVEEPIDIIAVWEGGLQFSGGFIAAVLVGLPTFRSWGRLTRWRMLDGAATGLAIGIALGRVGCSAVGEHFGTTGAGASWFPLAVRYEGGSVREPTLGGEPLVEGMAFHNTSLYSLIYMLILFVILWRLINRTRAITPGMATAVFCGYYAIARFGTDFLRVNDETLLGLTGAQYMTIGLAAATLWIIRWVIPKNRTLVDREVAEADETSAGGPAVDGRATGDTTGVGTGATDRTDDEVGVTSEEAPPASGSRPGVAGPG